LIETCGFGGGGAGRLRRTAIGFSAASATGKRKNESPMSSEEHNAMARKNLFMRVE
jgi:hypothetical protein